MGQTLHDAIGNPERLRELIAAGVSAGYLPLLEHAIRNPTGRHDAPDSTTRSRGRVAAGVRRDAAA